jgi:glucose/arabinose dehydrogenase
VLALAWLAVLAACGGGGGGGGGDDSSNNAPLLTSAAAAVVAESIAVSFYTATATDPDGDALVYSIAGGADAGRFSIGAQSGALSFITPPDCEVAGDANIDNVYLVRLRVSDGAAAATLDLTVTVTDTPGVLAVRRVVTGLAAPLFLTAQGQTPFVFVTERAGVVRILDPVTGQLNGAPFLNISAEVSTVGERGLLGFATAPDFGSTGVFYVHISNLSGATEIRRYRTSSGNPNVADPTSGDLILTVAQPASNHNGGWIGFGPDNLLYIALGDGGGAGDPFGNGQNPNTLLGAILRIDPSGDAFPADATRDYAIPAANPFASSGGAPEVWVWGLRNPFRSSFDRDTGNLFIGDVGQDAIEEIDLVRPSDGGANYGWNLYEGTAPYPPASPPAPTAGLTFPVAQYPHGAGPLQGSSVTGGYVYRGPVASLRGHYVFGDFINRRIWSIPTTAIAQGTTLDTAQFTDRTAAFAPDAGAIGNIASFGEDARGNLYILDIDGEIFVVTEEE